MKALNLLLVFLGAFFVGTLATGPSQIVLTATIRDFTPDHPDFEHYGGDSKGAIEDFLSADEKPILKAGSHPTFTSAAYFDQWYRISDPNRVKVITLTAAQQLDGSYLYNNQNYFPIDGQLLGNYANSGHNFHFTSEIKTTFGYIAGAQFNFQGDDDVFVFLGDGTQTKLVIDLGGVHGAESASFTLGAVSVPWTWDANKEYTMWIFHAERHTVASTFKFTTTIVFKPTVPPSVLTCPYIESRDGSYTCNTNTLREVLTASSTEQAVSPSQIDVLIEGLFSVQTGDTQGRVGSGRFAIGPGYSIGDSLNVSSTADGHAPYGLFAVSNSPADSWTSGELFPAEENIYAGGSDLTVGSAANLHDRVALNENSLLYTAPHLAADYASYFTCAKSYTTTKFSANTQASTVHYESRWSGLHIWCDVATSGSIVLSIPASTLSSSLWYQVDYAASGCDQTSDWIILVKADAASSVATLQGDSFPSLPGHVTYYFDNSITEVHVETAVSGSIVAPFSDIVQVGGVITGKVIGKSYTAPAASQVNRPCGAENVKLKSTISGLDKGKRSGNTVVEVDGFGGLIAGDTVTIDGSKTAVITALVTKNGKYFIEFDRVVSGIQVGSQITTDADFTIYRVNDVTDLSDFSSASKTVASLICFFMLALALIV